MGGFDQLIALGEDYINQSFAVMYKLAAPTSPIKKINITSRGFGQVVGELLPPELHLIVDETDFNSVKFYLRFKSGEMKTYTSTDPNDPTEATYDIKDWVSVFRVKINEKKLDDDSKENEDISKRMGYKPGELTLAKLFLDATTARMTDPALQKESNYGKYEPWDKQPAGVRSNWNSLVQAWVNNAAEDGKTLLGYALTPKTLFTTGTSPTFAPTRLQKQTYPYLDPATKPTPPPKNNLPQNMLMYLMMSNGSAPPSPELLIPNSGMWVDYANGIKGTFALSSELFWKSWLLPELQQFNKQTQFYIKDPIVSIKDDIISITPTFYTGLNPEPETYFAFDKATDLGTDTYGFAWGPYKFKTSASAEDGTINTIKAEATQEGENQSWVKIIPGSQLIEIGGKGEVSLLVDYTGTKTPPWRTYQKVTLTLTWSLTLEIASVDQGSVQLQIKDYDPNKAYYNIEVEDDKEAMKYSGLKDLNPKFAENTKEALIRTFRVIFGSLQTNLQNKLRGQNRLYLPGAGIFFFKNGTFNADGDFLTQVEYDGTDLAVQEQIQTQSSLHTEKSIIAHQQAVDAVESSRETAKVAQLEADRYAMAADIPDATEHAKAKAYGAKVYAAILTQQADALAELLARSDKAADAA